MLMHECCIIVLYINTFCLEGMHVLVCIYYIFIYSEYNTDIITHVTSKIMQERSEVLITIVLVYSIFLIYVI